MDELFSIGYLKAIEKMEKFDEYLAGQIEVEKYIVCSFRWGILKAAKELSDNGKLNFGYDADAICFSPKED